MKISKKELAERINKFCNDLTYQDRINFAKDGDKANILVADLCEILEGITADQIVKDVGEMSVNQWGELLKNDITYYANLKK